MSVTIKKNNDDYIFTANGYEINLIRVVNESTRANQWNIMGIFKDGKTVCTRGTDIVGVLKEDGESDFMGGVHGDEACYDFIITADGKALTDETECSRLIIKMSSHLTRVSSGENIIDRYSTIEIDDNSITVTTKFECLVNDFKLEIAFNGGMFAWRDNDAIQQRTNKGDIISDGGKTPYCIIADREITYAECLLENAHVKVENLIGYNNERYVGKAFYYGNEYNPRIKIYFSTDEKTVWNKGHICIGKARYTLT